MSKIEINPVSRKSNLVTQELEKEILTYDLIADKAFALNETSTLIWNLCSGKNSVSEITAKLSQQLNSPVSEEFIWLALEQLKQNNLLANGDEITIDFGGLSRRDVIRKVGFASLVTLPFVASLVAPRASQAASVCTSPFANGCSCTANGQCQTACCGATASGAANQSCVATGLDATGAYCRAGCECASNCCVGNSCQPGNVGVGGPCTTACQCATDSCNTGAGTCIEIAQNY